MRPKNTSVKRTSVWMSVLLALAVVVAACAEEEMEDVNLVAIHGSSPDFIALVPAAAWTILAEEGINVEQRYVEDASIAVQAMVQGEAQIGTNIGVNVGLLAVEEGAEIIDVIATQRPTWAFVSRNEFSSFQELDGKIVGVHSETSFTKALADFYARLYNIDMEQLIVPGSEVRAEALANDEIDASVIDLPDIVRLTATYPGSFTVLQTIGETLPTLVEQDVWLAKAWVDENPELAQRVTEGLIRGIRRLIDDPEFAIETATAVLPDEDPALLEELIDEYATRGLWEPNGILTRDTAHFTITFFAETGEIDVDPNAIDLDRYFAFDLLNSALDEVGRR